MKSIGVTDIFTVNSKRINYGGVHVDKEGYLRAMINAYLEFAEASDDIRKNFAFETPIKPEDLKEALCDQSPSFNDLGVLVYNIPSTMKTKICGPEHTADVQVKGHERRVKYVRRKNIK